MIRTPVRFLVLSLLVTASAAAQDWGQFARSAQHDAAVSITAKSPDVIVGEIVIDPNVDQEIAAGNGDLFVHYPVPLIDGDDLFLLEKGPTFTTRGHPETQSWNVKNVRRSGTSLTTRWKVETDWKPVPSGGGEFANWEQMYQPAMTGAFIYAPAAGGSMLKLNRTTGEMIARFNPFGSSVDTTIFTAGPPAIDGVGSVFYNAFKLDASAPYTTDVADSWLVRISADGVVTKASYNTLVPNAPKATDQCETTISPATGVLQTVTCGSQRPGVNVVPAIAADGTIYTVSRAHFTSRWGYLVAVNPNLTPKWSTSLRNRFADGCGVLLARTNTTTGCKTASPTGVDPADNQLGSGRVNDNSTSSPGVAPDGNILYGAYSSYNFAQGHLMSFKSDGTFAAGYAWGWDFTPAIWKHDNTYSLIMKENHYAGDEYYIVQLSPSFNVEWKYKSTETKSCQRLPNGTLQCVDDHPGGFEWCVNAVVVDGNGTAYANSEDGFLYAISQGGKLRSRVFLQLALGAAYTPLSIGRDGSIYTQNAGKLYIVGDLPGPRKRAVRH
jgi:hypothetical protein